jgi:hypothetical protein
MAFSSTVTKSDVQGTMICKVISASFAAVTSGAIKTGLSNIAFAVHNNEKTEGDGLMKINIASDGSTAEHGSLYFSGFTSNDVATVLVYGW